MAMPAHLTLEGERQGRIEGSCDMQGREKTILVYAMGHGITTPASPTDGLATGKRVHGPLSIIKEYDKSTPKLYQALCTGEHLKEVKLKWYRITKLGAEEHYFTHTLKEAIIVAMAPFMPKTFLSENEVYRHMEQVSFSYKTIKWTWEPTGIESEDSWDVPQ